MVAYLRRRGRDAYVSPTVGGITVVYDLECESQNDEVLHMITSDLSRAFECPALTALLHDSAFLWYTLYQSGHCVDSYNSSPAYFDDDVAPEPMGGNAAILCATFEAEQAVQEVDRLLHIAPLTGNIGDDDDEDFDILDTYLPAEDVHQAVARVLGWPAYTYSMGYSSILHENVPKGVDLSQLIKTVP